MNDIKDLYDISDYCAGLTLSALHPHVTMINLSDGKWKIDNHVNAVRFHFYAIFLKQGQQCELSYGRQNYDYQDGTLVFLGPGQIVNVSNLDTSLQPTGYALLFHPDLLRGSHLGNIINKYSFFSYDLHEALHISHREREIILDCLDKIKYELSNGIDRHSKQLIVSNIELFLNYCVRFYDRQFITRDLVNQGVIKRFNSSLHTYFSSGKSKEIGLPLVSYFAKELHLSSNYLGDLIKAETGKTAQVHIQDKIIDEAKNIIFDSNKTISEIAYELGFKHPQHFSRMFKKRVGFTPSNFRTLN